MRHPSSAQLSTPKLDAVWFCGQRGLTFFLALLSALPAASDSSAPAEARLAVDGRAVMPIIIAESAGDSVKTSAGVLADYLGRITGGTFEVRAGDGASGIVVGPAAGFGGLPVATAFKGGPLDREDYIITSRHNGIWLIGATDMAVQHAVWDLLFRIGHRQFFPGDTWEVVPSEPTVAVTIDTYERPAFHTRRIWYNWGLWGYNNQPYAQWTARNRALQGFRLHSGHAYGAILNANRAAFEKHPEFFALVNGERRDLGGDTKFCIGNAALRKLVVDHAVRQVRADPGRDSVSMDPSDGGNWCEDACALCAGIGNGSISDRVLLLANETAEAINALGLGDKRVGMYAYNQHSPPPSIAVHPNVIVSATTAFIRGGLTFDQIVEGWQAKGATTGVYDYFSVIAWDWNLPRRARAARPHGVAAAIKKYHAMGARFFDAEAGDAWGPYGLGYYVAARVLWDVAAAERVEAIIDDFLARAFGPAKQPMAAFYHLIGVDDTRRASADLLGRMYRRLAEARELSAHRPDVTRRIDDLILYTRYAELHEQQASLTGREQLAARDAMLTFAYRMRATMMVHVYGLWARTVGQGAAHQADHPLKSDAPIDRAEVLDILARGIAANQPVDLDFKAIEYSRGLVPAFEALRLPRVAPGRYPAAPQDQQVYYLWVDRAPAHIALEVTVQRVWANRMPLVTLHAAKDVAISSVDASDAPRPDGQTYAVALKTPYDGLHWVIARDGGDHTRIAWPAGVPVTVPSGLDDGAVFSHFRGQWSLYFYVPRGTAVVAGWAARIAAWAPRISGTLEDADGNVLLDFARRDDGWFQVKVPDGQDGRLWKFQNSQGVRQLATVPPYMARTAEDLLLPAEVVKADAR